MKRNISVVASAVGFWILSIACAFANPVSLSIQSISPGPTVSANSALTFTIVSSGFTTAWYQVSDSVGTSSSISSNDISAAGVFTWIPTLRDAGTHVLTFTASDASGNSASITQTIVVSPPPSLSIQSISPGQTIMPGTKLSFTVVPTGFSNPSYIAGDSFSGSDVGDTNIDAAGNFAWTPDAGETGQHSITLTASDSQGHQTSASIAIQVGSGATLTIQNISPGTTVSQGQTVTFIVNPSNYAPTAFSLADTFSGTTTLSNTNINSSGVFTWTPQSSDFGVHHITVTGTVGAYGQSTSTTQTLTVLGPGGIAPTATAATGIVLGSASSSGTTIGGLQSQLAALQAQLAQHSTMDSSSTSGIVFTSYLHMGSQGAEVTQLQTALAQQGFFSGTPSGYYGSATAAAVAHFQSAHGLSPLGVVGPATRTALNAPSSSSLPTTSTTSSTIASTSDGYVFNTFIGLGDNGTGVLELQKYLSVLGYLSVQPNGHFGNATEAAVKAFQTAHGIRAAGYVGPSTRAALNQ